MKIVLRLSGQRIGRSWLVQQSPTLYQRVSLRLKGLLYLNLFQSGGFIYFKPRELI